MFVLHLITLTDTHTHTPHTHTTHTHTTHTPHTPHTHTHHTHTTHTLPFDCVEIKKKGFTPFGEHAVQSKMFHASAADTN